MRDSTEDLLNRCWQLMEDHEPDGWPAVQMKTVTALCDEILRLTPKFDIGERVKVMTFQAEIQGEVVSRSEHKNICDRYAVYAKYPHKETAQAEWFGEDQLCKISKEDRK